MNCSVIQNCGTSGAGMPQAPYQVKKIKRSAVNEEVRPLIREKASILRNQYNELVLQFKSDWSLSFRLFNEELAYRFESGWKDSLVVVGENLRIGLQKGDSLRFQS